MYNVSCILYLLQQMPSSYYIAGYLLDRLHMPLWREYYLGLIISEAADTEKSLKTKRRLPFCDKIYIL